MTFQIFIFILILIIFLHKRYQYQKNNYIINSIRKNISEIKEGDILFCFHDYYEDSHNSHLYLLMNITQHLYTNKFFTHCGIVVKTDNGLGVLNLSFQPQYDIIKNKYTITENVVVDLNSFINLHFGSIFLYKCSLKDKRQINSAIIHYHKKRNRKIVTNVPHWIIGGIFDVNYFRKKGGAETCYQFIDCFLCQFYKKYDKKKNPTAVTLERKIKKLDYQGPYLIPNLYTQKYFNIY